MLTNSRTVRIEWGDCDPAGIVYYPRYFAIFDNCTHALFERALGMTKYQMTEAYRMIGCPMVDTSARFIVPSRFGDDVVVESALEEFRRSSFNVRHRLLKGAVLAVEAFETRVWAIRDPADPSRIKASPVPQDVIAAFKQT
ncbi:MAG: acyl-CoA thioesterase [Proteobacteria bacterium]|nr:acyl-CoA thioesterase [Pseudomonadota bacterium]MBI3497463.1 acyl-CoA thioesterase [Pseudomonadota bacterium]